jgi:hypothetical protein
MAKLLWLACYMFSFQAVLILSFPNHGTKTILVFQPNRQRWPSVRLLNIYVGDKSLSCSMDERTLLRFAFCLEDAETETSFLEDGR